MFEVGNVIKLGETNFKVTLKCMNYLKNDCNCDGTVLTVITDREPQKEVIIQTISCHNCPKKALGVL